MTQLPERDRLVFSVVLTIDRTGVSERPMTTIQVMAPTASAAETGMEVVLGNRDRWVNKSLRLDRDISRMPALKESWSGDQFVVTERATQCLMELLPCDTEPKDDSGVDFFALNKALSS